MILNKSELLQIIQEEISEVIRKSGGQHCLFSKSGNKNLGCYDTKAAANKREKQVQYFKNVKEDKDDAEGTMHFSPNQSPAEADKVTLKCVSEVKPKLKKSHPDWSAAKIEAIASKICEDGRKSQGAPLDHGEEWGLYLQRKRPGGKSGLEEQAWNKSNGRDYSKEYNKPGSKEQEERNKRKRDKRKHDKEHGECPDGTELHHVNGVENGEVECVDRGKNRGRKEKSRLKDGEIVIKVVNPKKVKRPDEANVQTMSDLMGVIDAIITIKKTGKIAGGLAKTAAAVLSMGASELMQAVIGNPSEVATLLARSVGMASDMAELVSGAKDIDDVIQSAASLPDSKRSKAGYLAMLDFDDNYIKILDNNLENDLLNHLKSTVRSNSNVPVDQFDINGVLEDWVQANFQRTMSGAPEKKAADILKKGEVGVALTRLGQTFKKDIK